MRQRMRRTAAALPLPSAQSLPRDDNDVKDGVHLARRDIMLAASANRLANADADADTDANANVAPVEIARMSDASVDHGHAPP